jgi:anti-sigma regulatory factor (Ser/Thr protein kinase)
VSEEDVLTASRPGFMPQAFGLLADDPAVARAAEAQAAVTHTLCPNAESVKVSRDVTRSALRDWDMNGLADRAELVVSELVTNALRHGLPSARKPGAQHVVGLRLMAEAPFVICMVTDPGDDVPVLQDSDPTAESGRGLTVVEACCVRWGWHPLGDGGKVVWALLR